MPFGGSSLICLMTLKSFEIQSDGSREAERGYTTQTLPSTPPTEGEDLESIVRRILPKLIADSCAPQAPGWHTCTGCPRLKKHLAMRPISSPTQTYNYGLAKWLVEKLQPLANNQYTITDTCEFAYEIRELKINNVIFLSRAMLPHYLRTCP